MSRRTPARRQTPDRETVRCAIYTRKSTDEGLDTDFNSLDAQREAAEAFIASQKHEGWTCLSGRYDDGGFSGGTMDRPALRRLLAEVEAGHIDCIVVYKVDRLSRSLLDFSRIMGTLDQAGTAFVSVTQQFNTTTSMGRLTLNVLLSFAQFEREIIGERTRDKMSAARRKGKWVGGIPILGYDIDPEGGRLLVNEAEASRVRELFALYAETESLTGTAQEASRRGLTTKRWVTRAGRERGGGPFEKAGVYNLLTNMTYLGKVDHRGTVYPGEHPAIVEEEVWQRVQRLLQRNGRSGGQAVRNKHGALVRGLLWCAACGVPMSHTYTRRGEKLYRYYVCGHAQRNGRATCPAPSLPAAEIERFVVDRVRAIGTDPVLRREVVQKVRASLPGRRHVRTQERHDLETRLGGRAGEARRSAGPGRGVSARAVALEDRMGAAKGLLGDVCREHEGPADESVEEPDVATALDRFDPIWETLSPREQARVVQLLVERVVWDASQELVAVTFRPGGVQALLGEEAKA